MNPNSKMVHKYDKREKYLEDSMIQYIVENQEKSYSNMGDFYNKNRHLVTLLPKQLYGYEVLEQIYIRAAHFADPTVLACLSIVWSQWEKEYEQRGGYDPSIDIVQLNLNEMSKQEVMEHLDMEDDIIMRQRTQMEEAIRFVVNPSHQSLSTSSSQQQQQQGKTYHLSSQQSASSIEFEEEEGVREDDNDEEDEISLLLDTFISFMANEIDYELNEDEAQQEKEAFSVMAGGCGGRKEEGEQ